MIHPNFIYIERKPARKFVVRGKERVYLTSEHIGIHKLIQSLISLLLSMLNAISLLKVKSPHLLLLALTQLSQINEKKTKCNEEITFVIILTDDACHSFPTSPP